MVTHHQVIYAIIINNIRLLNLYNYRLTTDDKLHEYSTLQSSRGKTGLTSFETWTGENDEEEDVTVDDDLIVENEEEEEECDSGWNDEEDCVCEDDILSDINDDVSESSRSITSGIGHDDPHLITWEEQMKLEQHPELAIPKQSYWLSINRLDGFSPSSIVGEMRPTCTTSCVSTMIPPRVMSPGERGDDQASPPLTPSLFPGQPSTIHFPLSNEKCKILRTSRQIDDKIKEM